MPTPPRPAAVAMAAMVSLRSAGRSGLGVVGRFSTTLNHPCDLLGWLIIGFTGLLFPRRTALIGNVLFPLGAFGALALAVLGLSGIGAAPQSLILPLGLPDLPFHLRLDALSAFFLSLLGVAGAGISIYGDNRC